MFDVIYFKLIDMSAFDKAKKSVFFLFSVLDVHKKI